MEHMDITVEAEEFRDAIDEWAKGYAARRRLAVPAETRGTEAESELRRWSHRHFSRLAAPANTNGGDGDAVPRVASQR